MNQENIQMKLMDYIDGLLPEDQRREVARRIEREAAWQQEYRQLQEVMSLMKESAAPEPDKQLRHDFNRLLQEEIQLQQERNTDASQQVGRFTQTYFRYAAAAALLLIGVLAGILFSRNTSQQADMHALQQEVQRTQQLVMASLQNQTSASKRLAGVLSSQAITTPDQQLLDALIKVLNHDDNTNVRLAALQALLQYRKNPDVFRALLASMVEQDDPTVQILLINTLVEFEDEQVKKNLQRIINDSTVPDIVKDEAHMGLFRIS